MPLEAIQDVMRKTQLRLAMAPYNRWDATLLSKRFPVRLRSYHPRSGVSGYLQFSACKIAVFDLSDNAVSAASFKLDRWTKHKPLGSEVSPS